MNEILICDFEGPDLGLEATPYTKLKQSVNVLEVVPQVAVIQCQEIGVAPNTTDQPLLEAVKFDNMAEEEHIILIRTKYK